MDARRSLVRAFAGRLLIALVVSSLVMGGLVLGVNRAIDSKLARIPRVPLDTAPVPPGGANYLLVGSDTRECSSGDTFRDPLNDVDGQRSDTIMVVHVEPTAQRTLIVSFPRDLLVKIHSGGQNKINAAFNDGPQGVIDTLADNFGIEIHHYIQLDFCSFIGLVDQVGFVPLYLPYAVRDTFTGLEINHGGCVYLNGVVALQYVRSRSLQYRDDRNGSWVRVDDIPDIGRIGRQQDFMKQLAGLAVQRSLDNPFIANHVADEVVDHLKVDDAFVKQDFYSLIDAFRTVNLNDTSALEFETLPWLPGPTLDVGQVLLVDKTLAAPLVARLNTFSEQAPPQVPPSAVRVQVVNATGRAGAGEGARDRLVELGFRAGTTSDAAKPVDVSEVHYELGVPASLERAKLVSRYLDPAAKIIPADGTGTDVVVVLGRQFRAILAPAGAVVPTTATSAPVDAGPPTTSTSIPSSNRDIASLPPPTARVGC